MKAIKNKTYNNFIRVMRTIEKKGYSTSEAEKMAHNVFDQYEAHPKGLSVLSLVDMIVPKNEWLCNP